MSTSQRNSSAFDGLPKVNLTRAEDFAAYDRLPAPVRRLISEAPDNYAAPLIAEALDAGMSVDGVVAALAEQIPDFNRAVMLKSYGPDHPMFKGEE